MTNNERVELTTERIEEAGLELFSRKPYAAVTMDEIAKTAGYSKRALYNHYPSKAALLMSIFEHRQEELYHRERAALMSCCTAEEVIYTHIRELKRFTRENDRFSRVFWSMKDYLGEGQISKELMSTVLEWTKRLNELPIKHLAEKERTGLLADYEPELIIHYINAVNKGMFMQYDKEATLDIKAPSWDDLSALATKCIQCFLEHP